MFLESTAWAVWWVLWPRITGTVGSSNLGLFINGSSTQFILQLTGVIVGIGYAVAGTFIIAFIVDKVMGLRVSPKEETVGLDQTQHGENGILFR